MFQFAQQNGVAEMQIRSSRIEARLHAERFARRKRFLELGAQFGFANDLRAALFYVCQLFVNGKKGCHGCALYGNTSSSHDFEFPF